MPRGDCFQAAARVPLSIAEDRGPGANGDDAAIVAAVLGLLGRGHQHLACAQPGRIGPRMGLALGGDPEWAWPWALRRRCVWPSVLCNVVWEEDRR